MEYFDRWKVSDGFESDHNDFDSAAENSPILKSKLFTVEVFPTLELANKKGSTYFQVLPTYILSLSDNDNLT